MAEREQEDVTLRQVVDLLIAVVPVVVVLGIQYRDELKRFEMQVRRWLERNSGAEDAALRQVQREISLMEHGGPDAG